MISTGEDQMSQHHRQQDSGIRVVIENVEGSVDDEGRLKDALFRLGGFALERNPEAITLATEASRNVAEARICMLLDIDSCEIGSMQRNAQRDG
jgi:hypothetical protein